MGSNCTLMSKSIFMSKVIVVFRARRKWRDDIGASYTMMTSNFSDVNDKIAVVFYCFNFFLSIRQDGVGHSEP